MKILRYPSLLLLALLLPACSSDISLSSLPGMSRPIKVPTKITVHHSPTRPTHQIARSTNPSLEAHNAILQAQQRQLALLSLRQHDDLAAGSVTRKLAAGTHTLVVTYWTGADPSTWTPQSGAIIQVAAHIEDATTYGSIKISRFMATITPLQTDITTTMTSDTGDFFITPPYTYGGAFTLPVMPATTSVALVHLEYDLLVETYPGSGEYFRQTVLDSLSLSFLPHSSTQS